MAPRAVQHPGQPVLLEGNGKLHFAAVSQKDSSSNNSGSGLDGGGIYAADTLQLSAVFGNECRLLAMASEQAFELKPLLQSIQPPLLYLCSEVKKSYAVETNAEAELNNIWTDWLGQALPMVARILYKQQYMQLLSSGGLQQLREMLVYDCPGLKEVLTLGSVIRREKAFAVAKTGDVQGEGREIKTCPLLRIDPTCKARTLLQHVAEAYGDLLLGGSSVGAERRLFQLQVKDLLSAFAEGDGWDEAEEQLEHLDVGEIPQELRLWRMAGHGDVLRRKGTFNQLDFNREIIWDDESDEEEGEGEGSKAAVAGEADKLQPKDLVVAPAATRASVTAAASHDDLGVSWSNHNNSACSDVKPAELKAAVTTQVHGDKRLVIASEPVASFSFRLK
jgi:hypothetical protein